MAFGFCWWLAEGLHRHRSLSQLLWSAHARATGLCPGVQVTDHQPPPLEPRQNFHPLLRMIEEWVKDINPKQCVRYPASLAQLMYFLQKLYFRSSGCTFSVCPEPTIFYSTDFSEITFLESKEKNVVLFYCRGSGITLLFRISEKNWYLWLLQRKHCNNRMFIFLLLFFLWVKYSCKD